MRSTGLITVFGLLVLVLGLGLSIAPGDALAATPQDADAGGETPPETPAEPAQDDAGAAGKARHFGLYVFAGTGTVDSKAIDLSNESASTNTTFTELTFEGMAYGQAALGWKLANDKGDFRLVFNGFKEDGYRFHSVGSAAVIDPTLNVNARVQDNLTWWTVDIVDGNLTSVRTPPQWTLAADANGDGFVDAPEVSYIGPDISATGSVVSDLENRVQTVDVMFGNSFGPERVSATWWAGLRYFEYEGTLLAGAWLSTKPAGELFTDGAFSGPLQLRHEASGYGPMTAMELDVNFFRKRVSLFAKGGAAFLFENLKSDSGSFSTYVTSTDPEHINAVPAEISAERDKSVWHTHLEGGVRVSLKNGLRLEMAYHITGFLDSVLSPTVLRIPLARVEAPLGTSATFRTSDIVVDGWRAGVGFQF